MFGSEFVLLILSDTTSCTISCVFVVVRFVGRLVCLIFGTSSFLLGSECVGFAWHDFLFGSDFVGFVRDTSSCSFGSEFCRVLRGTSSLFCWVRSLLGLRSSCTILCVLVAVRFGVVLGVRDIRSLLFGSEFGGFA